jgi:photosynthetic reaction center cytochrome c subunit
MRILGGLVATVAVLLTVAMFTMAGWSRPPVETVQRGYRGTGMQAVVNPREFPAKIAANAVPEPQPPAEPTGEPASAYYENLQVLGDLDAAEFDRLMMAITEWVSPEQGCAYCHGEEGDFAGDHLYTKIVSRRMLQMTQHINGGWDEHVGDTGVTCYTCHRGKNVPDYVWFDAPETGDDVGLVGYRAGQNAPAPAIGLASLPYDPFSTYLGAEGDPSDIRVVGDTALPNGNRHSIKQTEGTYALMMHMSQALDVNCTYCHNTRAFTAWDQSSAARVSAWYGIRMVADLNVDYLEPLGPQYPEVRLGPTGDAPKANCTTCHRGAFKPLYGASMLDDYPSLDPHAAPLPAEDNASQ